jgi:glycosyltransferase involved in cell wall biosynthesis
MPGTAAAPLATGSAGSGAVGWSRPIPPRATCCDRCAGRLQDRDWTLHCVGSTTRDAATADSVRVAITSHGLDARVQLHGEVNAEALQDFYDRADVFVLPSLHEGYGMALAEALAHGLPVVSSTAGAIADTVPPSAGLLLPPGDGIALRRALARVDEPPCASLAAAHALLACNCRPGRRR